MFVGVAYVPSTFADTFSLNGVDGSFTANEAGLRLSTVDAYNNPNVQVSSRVDPGLNLVRTRSFSALTSLPPAFLSVLSRDDAMAVATSYRPVVSGPIEAADGTDPIGEITGTAYFRAPGPTAFMATAVTRVTPGSTVGGAGLANAFVGWAYTGSALALSYRFCARELANPSVRYCSFTNSTQGEPVPFNVIDSVSAAISSTGCVGFAYETTAGRRAGVMQAGSFFGPAPIPIPTSAIANHFSVAARPAGGFFAAWQHDAQTVQLAFSTPSTCTFTNFIAWNTSPGTVSLSGYTSLRVVQLGTRPAVLYLTSGRELRIAY